MVKAFTLLLLLAVMCARANALLTTTAQHRLQERARSPLDHHHHQADDDDDDDDDVGSETRSERSAANLSHHHSPAAGANSRKVQFFVKNYHLQILPDGTVNGTLDDGSIFTILQRTAVGIGKLRIQGVGTCQYLCMAPCGLLYGSHQFTDECVFNEKIQQHHYNTYSSSKYSNDRRTLYLAFNRRGVSRRVLLHVGLPLGRLSQFTRVMTRLVPPSRLEEMQPPMRHHTHLCDASPLPAAPSSPRCRRHKKRKRKRRKCAREEERGEDDGDAICEPQQQPQGGGRCADETSDECQRNADASSKTLSYEKPKKTKKKAVGVVTMAKAPVKAGAPRKRLKLTTTPLMTTLVEDFTDEEEDYVVDATTTATATGMLDWDVDATVMAPPAHD